MKAYYDYCIQHVTFTTNGDFNAGSKQVLDYIPGAIINHVFNADTNYNPDNFYMQSNNKSSEISN